MKIHAQLRGQIKPGVGVGPNACRGSPGKGQDGERAAAQGMGSWGPPMGRWAWGKVGAHFSVRNDEIVDSTFGEPAMMQECETGWLPR